MPRSEHLAAMTTPGLHQQRAACLHLTNNNRCSPPVTEYHADEADRISDEIDTRNNT